MTGRDPDPRPEDIAAYRREVERPAPVDLEGEEAMWLERLVDFRACTCTWDANLAEDGPDDVVVKPDPDCLAHGILSALTEALKERDELRLELDARDPDWEMKGTWVHRARMAEQTLDEVQQSLTQAQAQVEELERERDEEDEAYESDRGSFHRMLEQAEQRAARLEEALRPFAEYAAAHVPNDLPDEATVEMLTSPAELRQARSLLSSSSSDEG